MARVLALAVLLAVVASGCLSSGSRLTPAALPSAPQVAWRTPQLAAHPAFGWPTLDDPSLPGRPLPAWWAPIPARELPAQLTKLQRAGGAAQPHVGAGIALFGSLAAVSGWSGRDKVAFRLYDIRDPVQPRLLAAPQGTPGRDADFIAYPDGRLVLVMASDYKVDPVWDVTDPAHPKLLTEIQPPHGSHNVLVVPGTPILYNANSRGGGPAGAEPATASGSVEVYDLSQPAAPRLVEDFANGYGCHDITAYVNASQGKLRAYCAGVEMTQVWDIADPASPRVLANIPMPAGPPGGPSPAGVTGKAITVWSHTAEVNHDASVLIVADETGGGGLPPGCDAHADTPAGSASGPLGNLWFYDLRDERNPELKGWVSPTTTLLTKPGTVGSCTAHFGREIADRNVAAWAFYTAGTLLVDFRDPAHPVILDSFADGTDTWDAWSYQGYVFTGDLARGLDVLVPG